MTLEDDVESILSEQFNVSNESMFRVRGEIKVPNVQSNAPIAVSASQGFGGLGGGGAGDSTYRACDDSVYGYDDDKGLISESDDGGWYTNTGNDKDNAVGTGAAENKFDDISEHTSDEMTDSDPEENQAEGDAPKKSKKKAERGAGEKKKKKKKKTEAPIENAADTANLKTEKKDSSSMPLGKNIIQTYKKLEENKDINV